MLKEILLKKSIDITFEILKSVITHKDVSLKTKKEDLELSFDHHYRQIENWCKQIKILELDEPIKTINTYIDLNLNVTPLNRMHLPSKNKIESLTHYISKKRDEHLVILGQPGSGKTTSIKYICNKMLNENEFFEDYHSILLIRLKDLKPISNFHFTENSLINNLAEIIDFNLYFPDYLKGEENKKIRSGIFEKTILHFINEMKTLILLDGFDEIPNLKEKEEFIKEFSYLCLSLNKSKIILTTRTADFPYSIDNTNVVEICPLNHEQIVEFSKKWFNDELISNKFIKELTLSPYYDTMLRPLNLAHLCAIYQKMERIPKQPKTVYNKIVNLLLVAWDEERQIKRTSEYSKFFPEDKCRFLWSLSFEISVIFKKYSFNTDDLQIAYKNIYKNFGLPANDSKKVAREIESHTGLIIQSNENQFEFSHRSIQEFLCAEYLMRLPEIPTDLEILKLIPNELAISIAISSNNSQYITYLVYNRFLQKHSLLPFDQKFYFSFISRLIQEKPEFNDENDTILSILILYSYCLEQYYFHGANEPSNKNDKTEKEIKNKYDKSDEDQEPTPEKIKIVRPDRIIIDFEMFIKRSFSKNKINSIFNNYQLTSTTFRKNNAIVNVLEKKSISFKYRIPNKLYILKSFFE